METVPRTSRLTSLAYLPDPECPKYGRFAWPKGYFQPIWASFWPPWGHIWGIFVWQIGQTGQPGCPRHCFHLVSTLSSQKLWHWGLFILFYFIWAYYESLCHWGLFSIVYYIWAYYGLSLPGGWFFHHFHLENRPNIVWLDALFFYSNFVPPLLIQNRQSGQICVAKQLFSFFWGATMGWT